jgi:hypothetical protein
MGGLMAVTGLPGQGPIRAGAAIADISSGLYAAIGIFVALQERARSGEGQWVQSSLLEAQIAVLDFQAARYLVDGVVPEQSGNDHPYSTPMGVFATSDGFINLGVGGDGHWKSLCGVFQKPDWVSDPNGTFYLLGSAVGPHPYPYLVRELQSIIGREAREQFLKRQGRLPDAVFACVGGGSNAIGMFHAFVPDRDVAIIGVEAGGRGSALGQNAASLSYGWPGVLQGCYSLLLQDENGQIYETDSISAGLDYPGVGPEHALLLSAGRVQYESATDEEALDALQECARMEGILPALETAHALHGAKRWAALNPGKHLLLNMSGRGDKDMPTLQRTLLSSAPAASGTKTPGVAS